MLKDRVEGGEVGKWRDKWGIFPGPRGATTNRIASNTNHL